MHIYVYIGDKTQIKWTMSQLTSTITEYNICIRCYVHMLHDNLTYHHVKSSTVTDNPVHFLYVWNPKYIPNLEKYIAQDQ